MKTALGMKDLYQRFKDAGVDRGYLRKRLLPDWWNDSLARNPANRAMVETILARTFGLPVSALRDPSVPISFEQRAAAQFKRREGFERAGVVVALATRVAEVAARACLVPFDPSTPLDLLAARSEALRSGSRWMGLDEVLDYCWNLGIPVVHLTRLPKGCGKAMDGMICLVGERPVIVVTSNRGKSAWHLFIVVHELGHYAAGHLTSEAPLCDVKIGFESSTPTEQAANEKALTLLTGSALFEFRKSRNLTANRLAMAARIAGQASQIDPGFLVLSNGHCHDRWPLANAALNHLAKEDGGDDAGFHYRRHYANLDFDSMSESNRGYFESVTEEVERGAPVS